MTRLYDPARHEPLTDQAWDPDAARQAIATIIADAQAAAAPAGGVIPASIDADFYPLPRFAK